MARSKEKSLLAAAIAVALAAAATAQAEPVGLRAWALDGFGRIVFDWPTDVGFRAAVADGRLRVTFERPVEAVLDPALAAMPSYLAGGRIEGDARTVVFDLRRPVTLRTFRDRTSIALDLVAEGGPLAAAPAGPAETGTVPTAAPAPIPTTTASTDPASGTLPPLRVRGGIHPDRGRLVFDWPRTVGYTTRQEGRSVRIEFDRAAAADLRAVERRPPRNIEAPSQRIEDGRLIVTLTVPEGSTIRHFRHGTSVALDVIDPPRARDAAPKPAGTPVTAEERRKADAKPPTPAPAKTQPPVQIQARAAAEPPPPAAAPAMPVRQAGPSPALPAAGSMAAGQAAPAEAQGTSIVVDPRQPAAAAVFLRAGYLHVVLDRALPAEAAPAVVPGGRSLGTPEPLTVSQGSGFRVAVPAGLHPSVAREGTAWRIALAPSPGPRDGSLQVEPQPGFLLGPRVLIRAEGAATVVTLGDVSAGDRLLVVPLPDAGQAVVAPHSFLQARLLPSAQGLVVRPLDDTLAVRPVRDGIELAADGGMLLSSAEDVRRVSPPPVEIAASASEGGPLFHLAAWSRPGVPDLNRARQEIQDALAAAPEAGRNRLRLDLARFLFARGFGPEALGALELLALHQPELADQPQFLALRGAARVLAGHCGEAAADLKGQALDGWPEARLWRAAAAACIEDWPSAARGFGEVPELVDSYPEPFGQRLALMAARASVETGAGDRAERLLDRLVERRPEASEHPGVRYLRGRARILAGEPEAAAAQLREAAASSDRYYRTRAELALVDLDLEQGAATPGQAVERLERLRFAWRGDGFELAVLRRLGDAYLQAGRPDLGLETLRAASTLYPDDPQAKEADDRLRQAYVELFLKDGGKGLSPIDALALYDEFGDYRPSGPEGDRIGRKLAERLVEIDLLGRAGDMLQQQVETRLSGPEKGEVGARLASIRLLDGKPEQALRALDLSEQPDLPAETVSERQVLRAKALAESGRAADAMALLGRETSQPADLLRVDIAWRAGHWAEAAAALDRVIGAPPPSGVRLEAPRTSFVLKRAVALSLAEDAAGIEKLRADFSAAMAGTAEADTFRLLTRGAAGGGGLDLATIQRRVAEVDLFRDFLTDYRGSAGGA